jgi:hypothetical protein
MPTPRHFPVNPLPEPAHNSLPAQALPAELEARLAALETGASRSDFGGLSWFWMILIGIVIPLLLLAIGWWA